jgi:EH_Signature domain
MAGWCSTGAGRNAPARPPLAQIVQSLDQPTVQKAVKCPTDYVDQWSRFRRGELAQLTPQAVRSLCWEPAAVSDKRFAKQLSTLEVITPRQIQGLLHSLHRVWSKEVEGGATRRATETAIARYAGKHRLIRLWREHSAEIIGARAPETLGERVVFNRQSPDTCFAQLRIDAASTFAQASVAAAAQECRRSWRRVTERIDYGVTELLPWPHWDLPAFKKEIGAVIVDDVFSVPERRDRLKAALLKDSRLGDLRLPHRRGNWAMVDLSAQRRFLEWLSRDDIVFFFEHALPQRLDPHLRKDFWLPYVKKIQVSRPLLSAEDHARLRAILRQKPLENMNIGRIDETTSAFILGFGDVWVVEFSRPGNACYVYRASEFKKMVRDIWMTQPFRNGNLKNPATCLRRVVHRDGWQSEMASELARLGITPA